MLPFLQTGDRVLVSKFSKAKLGDTVVLHNPQEDKRIKYLVKKITNIKNDQIYVEGINKIESIDSKMFGWISIRNIIGKVIKKL